jgi:hypothetical protein
MSLFYSAQTGSGYLSAAYPIGTGIFLAEVKQPGCKPDHLPLSSNEVKNGGAIPPLPTCVYGVVLNCLKALPYLYILYMYYISVPLYLVVGSYC